MFPKDYLPLSQDEETIGKRKIGQRVDRRTWHFAILPALAVMLLVSVALNVFSCSRLLSSKARGGVTRFASLTWDTPHVIEYQSRFSDPDRDVENAAWESDLVDPNNLVVALEDSLTESWGILHSMRWPWDSRKGVYTLNSAHELHCLHLLRRTVNQAYDSTLPQWPRKHTMHCLEYLLQSIMCNADDTPLYQGLLHWNHHAEHPIGGLGDTRKCRDWNQLQTWARQHSACYNQTYRAHDSGLPEHERYKFCPDGSKPWEDVQS